MLKKIWFESKPRTALTTRFIQSTAKMDVACMTRIPFHTLTVNLQQEEECILSQSTPNCRNEIRRGKKIGLNFHAGPTTQADADFIHHFLDTKNLSKFSRTYLTDPMALVCTSNLHGTRLATHLYVVSTLASRARLVYSAVADPTSVTSFGEISPKRLIGIANRFLHFSSILHFKTQGLNVYDFGGIGQKEDDQKIKGINEFKRSFGGAQVIEYNYIPTWISVVEKILQRRAARMLQHHKQTKIC